MTAVFFVPIVPAVPLVQTPSFILARVAREERVYDEHGSQKLS
jgi:hypothetical protein